jgi:hypothetical protein
VLCSLFRVLRQHVGASVSLRYFRVAYDSMVSNPVKPMNAFMSLLVRLIDRWWMLDEGALFETHGRLGFIVMSPIAILLTSKF